jgi:hypothetical protein
MEEDPGWPPPREPDVEHVEPDGSAWRWRDGAWVQTAPPGTFPAEDVLVEARQAMLVLAAGRAGAVGTCVDVEPGGPGADPLDRDHDGQIDFLVREDGSGWLSERGGPWRQIDPIGTYSDKIELDGRVRGLLDLAMRATEAGRGDEEAVVALLALAGQTGDADRILRIALRALPRQDWSHHARRLLVAALSGEPAAPPDPAVERRLAEARAWLALPHDQKWASLVARAPELEALVAERVAASGDAWLDGDAQLVGRASRLLGGTGVWDQVTTVLDELHRRLDPEFDPDAG